MPSVAEVARIPVLHGALGLAVLRALAITGPQHAYGLAVWIEHIGDGVLPVNPGTIYATLVRLDRKGWIKATWRRTEAGRQAKYFDITKTGRQALDRQTQRWRHLAGVLNKLLIDK